MLNIRESATLNFGRKLDVVSGVIINAGKDSAGNERIYSAGDTNGYVLEISSPYGSQQAAEHILSSLKLRGFRYQPFSTNKSVVDPACEIGDNAASGETASIIFARKTPFTDLMASDLSAKFDEEIDHEYGFVPRISREFSRESAYTRSRLSIAEDNITAEVVRATEAEGTLSGQISVQADLISAKVSRTGGSSASFGWNLTDSLWELVANGSTVFKVNSSGATVKGRITATSGYIGSEAQGFAISANNIKNGMASLSDTANYGVYVGTDGIALGAGAFKVTASGAVTCSSITISGGEIKGTTKMTGGKVGGATVGTSSFGGISIPSSGGSAGKLIIPSGHFGEKSIDKNDLKDLAVTTRAIDNHAVLHGQIGTKEIQYDNVKDNTLQTGQMSSGINTNLANAAEYKLATVNGTSAYPDYFRVGALNAYTISSTLFTFKGQSIGVKHITIDGTMYNLLGY